MDPVSRLKETGSEGPFLRFRVEFRRPGFKYEYQYRKTLPLARSCVDRMFRQYDERMCPATAVICGTTRYKGEVSSWEMVETYDNLLYKGES